MGSGADIYTNIDSTLSQNRSKGVDVSFSRSSVNKSFIYRYVIHAMVYQVGILTNKTDNETSNSNVTT